MAPREILEKAVRLARGLRTPDPLWAYVAAGCAIYLRHRGPEHPYPEDHPLVRAAAAMIERHEADLMAATRAYTHERLKHLNRHCPGCDLDKPCEGLPPHTVEA